MSDGTSIIVKAGSAGGSVTLLGRPTEVGEWRFALAAVDCTAELVGEMEVSGAERPSLEWVDSWPEGLKVLDRYPWVQLYPQEVHPLFVEEARLAVAKRLALLPSVPRCEKQRQQWERVLQAAAKRR